MPANLPGAWFLGMKVGLLDGTKGKAFTALFMFSVAVIWCFVRSTYVDSGKTGLAEDVVPVGIRIGFLIAVSLPAFLFVLSRSHLAWLAGLSAALGALPRVPLLPFLYDYAHMTVLLWSLVLFTEYVRGAERGKAPLHAKLFALYFLTAILSAIINYVIFGNLWQLKVGVAFFLLFGPVCFLIYALAVKRDGCVADFDRLLDGFVWGVFAQVVIAFFAIPALIYSTQYEGNDTILGLGYYYRYKATFPGPVSLGFFFLTSVPLTLLWLHRRGSTSSMASIYFQIVPWLMMATASRTVRIAAIAPFLMLLILKATRRTMVFMLPSAILAYWICFSYVSLPAALTVLFGGAIDPSLNMSERFFVTNDRVELVREATLQMLHASLATRLFGFGPGVGGYSASGYPIPHNMLMNLWVETGVLGTASFFGFLVTLFWAVFRHVTALQTDPVSARLLAIGLISFALANAAYQTSYWGYALILILLVVCGIRLYDVGDANPTSASRASSSRAEHRRPFPFRLGLTGKAKDV
ncbi:hypothetical protein SAMN05216573_11399 [Bradyrhizobium sp. Rc3b]|uniref:O-antigen ligase family protein n=2 Tax=unclassified Bradyrhizobium TaxID=2631580 RepID=UPI0008F340B9|nr:O-antigen ligase family protein [Bradyrhizobium sp. Rc3b]SFN44787.1 hypothetical protein SAMN05216573_11399 [Bradyrhizobium sp. Rc3b]